MHMLYILHCFRLAIGYCSLIFIIIFLRLLISFSKRCSAQPFFYGIRNIKVEKRFKNINNAKSAKKRSTNKKMFKNVE